MHQENEAGAMYIKFFLSRPHLARSTYKSMHLIAKQYRFIDFMRSGAVHYADHFVVGLRFVETKHQEMHRLECKM